MTPCPESGIQLIFYKCQVPTRDKQDKIDDELLSQLGCVTVHCALEKIVGTLHFINSFRYNSIDT